MFYSHEILTSSQYGVSTIWLIATVGRASTKKVTRKAIQEVNVPKACEKIIDPGAPLALRLQGNLLYGVSRVFSHQCNYVLSDAEKTQTDMMMFFRVLKTSDTDPQAGKAKRHQITLQDDPSFDPSGVLPNLDLLSSTFDLCFLPSQCSTQKGSQFTPLGGSQGSLSSGYDNSLFNFNFAPSSHSGGSYQLEPQLGQSSPKPKKNINMEPIVEADPFVQEELEPLEDLGIIFDDDGNLVGEFGEPDLPALPGAEAPAINPAEDYMMTGALPAPEDENPFADDNMLIMDEALLPDAEPFPQPLSKKRPHSLSSLSSESSENIRVAAPSKRRRRRKISPMIDQKDQITNAELRNWNQDYLTNMDASRKKPRATTAAQARNNAIAFLFGNGVCGVGVSNQFADLTHPLAEDFAGDSLRARLQGRLPEEIDRMETPRGVRRTSAEAFEDEIEEERRVKQKTEGNFEIARGIDDLGDYMLGDDTAPELGMDAATGMEEHHSSSLMPWNRPPSVVPSSSIRGHGSAQKGVVASSPLIGRGSVVKSIERYSDAPGPAHGSDNFPQLHSQDSSIDFGGGFGGDFGGDFGPIDFAGGDDTQTTSAGLDIASREFLEYATAQAQSHGIIHPSDKGNRRWINFEELADPTTHTKGVAAQAFLHVLSLATKNAIAVHQQGIDRMEPFGTINIGLTVSQGVEVDELA